MDEARQTGRSIAERMASRVLMNVPGTGENGKLRRVIELVNADDELYALWTAVNVNAVERLGMTDHGPVHVKIVMNIADKIFRLLTDFGVEPGAVRNYSLSRDDAEVVVILAALLHDVGMSIHRSDHETYSLFIAERKITQLLGEFYDLPTTAILRSEILHAIIAHRSGGKPLTLEAGIVRDAGSMSIHSVSAAAIEAIHIEVGETKPVRIRIELSNSAGIFQLDQLFREKLAGSGLEPYLELEAEFAMESEKRIVERFHL